jgi:hypothetical protein
VAPKEDVGAEGAAQLAAAVEIVVHSKHNLHSSRNRASIRNKPSRSSKTAAVEAEAEAEAVAVAVAVAVVAVAVVVAAKRRPTLIFGAMLIRAILPECSAG